MHRPANGDRSPRPSDQRTSALVLSRRRVVAAALGMAGAVSVGPGLNWHGDSAAGQEGVALAEPVVWRSENGLLTGTFRAQRDASRGPGAVAYEAGGFGGAVPGPTLRVAPGDRIRLTLENQLGELTNLHVHGLHVSPLGHGDNVFVHVMPGDTFNYEYQIPANHPTGVYWYHPHHHGLAQKQTKAGLAGAILIADGQDEPPEVKAAPEEHLLVFQNLDPPLVPDEPYYLNGQVRPVIAIRTGQLQLWRIVNASANIFFNLRVVGHKLRRVGLDGNWVPSYRSDPEFQVLPLGPAERADVLITGGEATSYEIRSLRKGGRTDAPFFDEDFVGDDLEPDAYLRIATLESKAASATPESATGTPVPFAPSFVNLRGYSGIKTREVRFQVDDSSGTLTLDGRSFDADRIDQTVELGAVEEWTVFNETNEFFGWHPFHLHINDFDVLRTSHDGLREQFYLDTIPLPPKTDGGPGWVVFRTRFADFTGKFVYHCHFLDHEDAGMMGVVEVVQPVKIAGAAFDPPTVTVNAGTTVLWTNHDAAPHAVRATNGSFASGPLQRGQSFAYTFAGPGPVAYGGDAKVGMQGTVVVEETTTVEIVGSAFSPAELQVGINTTVVWTNRDAESRSVTATDGSFASGPLAPEASFGHTFDAVGTFAYRGDSQGSTQGTVVVGETATSPTATVWIEADGFDPPQLPISVGTIVTWTNRAGGAHTVTADDGTSFDSGRLDPEQLFSPGQRFSHTFVTPGTVGYHCALAMQGKVVVVEVTAATEDAVAIVDFAFVPSTIEVPVGATVTWTNQGPASHTVTSDDGAAFDSGTIDPGKPFSHTFAMVGEFAYHCEQHRPIAGEIVVT